MSRAHFYRPILDSQGNIVTDAQVTLLQAGTDTPITDPIYSGWSGPETRTNPWSATNGAIDFFLDAAQTVRIKVSRPSQPDSIFDYIDVGDPEDYKETFTFTLAGAVSTQVGSLRYYIEDACEVSLVRASVGVAPGGSDLILDVNKNGTTMFTNQANRPRVVQDANTGTAVPAVAGMVSGDYLTIDIDQVGSSTAGADLVVQVRVRRLA